MQIQKFIPSFRAGLLYIRHIWTPLCQDHIINTINKSEFPFTWKSITMNNFWKYFKMKTKCCGRRWKKSASVPSDPLQLNRFFLRPASPPQFWDESVQYFMSSLADKQTIQPTNRKTLVKTTGFKLRWTWSLRTSFKGLFCLHHLTAPNSRLHQKQCRVMSRDFSRCWLQASIRSLKHSCVL